MTEVIVGIDEVGRGCWAGPMVVGAVILEQPIDGLKDSKCLSKAARLHLSEEIINHAWFAQLGWVWPQEIDQIGLTAATTLGITRALKNVPAYEKIIIDGSINFLPDNPLAHNLIQADSLVQAVSAASIIAKVARDQYMTAMAGSYPEYGFDKHVGYGTTLHKQALEKCGVTSIHRKSYKPIKALL